MLVLRQDGDDAASRRRRAGRWPRCPARLGGLLRELPASAAAARRRPSWRACAVRAISSTPRPAGAGSSGPGPDARSRSRPGAGGQLLVRTTGPADGRLVVRGTARGSGGLPDAPRWSRSGASWARPLLPARQAPGLAEGRAPAPPPCIAPPRSRRGGREEPPALRGRMERDVVQRALGYAFLPRARACYLTRAIKSAADFQLKGRLRLELHLERGEMMAAAVRRSTLGRPDIEDCLREAAFAVEVPRALHSDAPVIAALNLVFRPRTEAEASGRRRGDDAIDRILGPLPPPSDPLELLIEDSLVPDPACCRDRGAKTH